jgi:hypothetical protein
MSREIPANNQPIDAQSFDAIDDSPISRAELLVNMLVDDCISEHEFTELSSMLEASPDVRKLYIETVALHVDLMQHFGNHDESPIGKSPVLSFLGDLMPVDPHKMTDNAGS